MIVLSPPLLLTVLIGKLWLTGTLGYYVNSRTVPIVLAGGALFALVGLAGVLRSRKGHYDDLGHHADHDHHTAHKAQPTAHTPQPMAHTPQPTALPEQRTANSERPRLWRTLVFLVPILIGLAVPARPLSAGTGQAATLGSLQLASHVSSGSSGDSFGSWISALGSHPDPQWWAGQPVSLVGFAMHQAGLPARGLIVGRFLVTCCVVDATLLGFPVIFDRGKLPADGTWIQVNGSFASSFWTDASGNRLPLIVHARISPVAVPAAPYLSP